MCIRNEAQKKKKLYIYIGNLPTVNSKFIPEKRREDAGSKTWANKGLSRIMDQCNDGRLISFPELQ